MSRVSRRRSRSGRRKYQVHDSSRFSGASVCFPIRKSGGLDTACSTGDQTRCSVKIRERPPSCSKTDGFLQLLQDIFILLHIDIKMLCSGRCGVQGECLQSRRTRGDGCRERSMPCQGLSHHHCHNQL